MSTDDNKTIADELIQPKDSNEESDLEQVNDKEDAAVETADNNETAEEKAVVTKGRKKKKKEPFLRGGRGQIHIKSSYNNTIVTITDLNGSVLAWSSAGKCGFKGPKKSTPYAAGVIVKSLIDKIKALGIKETDVEVKGVGMGREAAVRALGVNGVQVVSVKDVTPVKHGGVRSKRPRRV